MANRHLKVRQAFDGQLLVAAAYRGKAPEARLEEIAKKLQASMRTVER